jgi:hypothetical protein
MEERHDTSGVPEPLDSGYRLAARGRQEAEDDRLGLLEDIFDPFLVDGVTWSTPAGANAQGSNQAHPADSLAIVVGSLPFAEMRDISGIVTSKSVIGLPACLFASTSSKPSEMRLLNLPPAVLSSTMQTIKSRHRPIWCRQTRQTLYIPDSAASGLVT